LEDITWRRLTSRQWRRQKEVLVRAGLYDLTNARELLWAWTVRTVKARYQQSLLGGAWAIVQPAAAAVIFSVIFTYFVPIDTEGAPYLVFSYTALVPWILFSGTIMDMVESLVGNMNLISKIYFPREVLPMAAALARLLDFAIAFAILVVLLLLHRMPVFTPTWLYLPVILVMQSAFTLGLGLAGAALNVFYRDMRHLYGLGLQLWLYASPVIYPVSAVPEQWRALYFMNPMAGFLASYRDVILYQQAPGPYFAVAATLAMVFLFAGYLFFRKVERRFADIV
jgi:lipopolysaccharide transport system permease protein